MTYKSPIKFYTDEWSTQFDNGVMDVVQHCGFTVDKNELLKALNYDRNSYEKGFKEGVEATAWIPCSKRLPEYSDVYLITLAWKDNDLWTVTAKFDVNYKNWKGLCGCERVIAWMPLPEPYKGEQK